MAFNRCVLFSAIIIFTFLMTHDAKTLDPEQIVGGYYAEEHFLKYHVGIISRAKFAFFYKALCGGGIIADNFVLSAAHCFLNDTLNLIEVSYFVIFDKVNFQILTITNIDAIEVDAIYTFSFEPQYNLNDLAVLKLKESLKINDNPYLSKLDLPDPYESFAGRYGTVSGFGCVWVVTRNDPCNGYIERIKGSTTKLLKYGTVRIFAGEDLDKIDYKIDKNTQICGSIVTDGEDQKWGICWGDSGNPLVVDNKLVGIVSKGPNDCNDSVFPGIYTQISYYVQFIRQILEGHPMNNTYTYDL